MERAGQRRCRPPPPPCADEGSHRNLAAAVVMRSHGAWRAIESRWWWHSAAVMIVGLPRAWHNSGGLHASWAAFVRARACLHHRAAARLHLQTRMGCCSTNDGTAPRCAAPMTARRLHRPAMRAPAANVWQWRLPSRPATCMGYVYVVCRESRATSDHIVKCM